VQRKESYAGFLKPPGLRRASCEGERVWLFVRAPTDTVGAIVMEPDEVVATDRTCEAERAAYDALLNGLSFDEYRQQIENIRSPLFVPNFTFECDYGFFYEKMVSRPVVAVFLMGAFEERYLENGQVYTYDDLTDDGKAFYDFIKTLYPGSELYLVTALDT
jgi:hypothetical protein